MLLTASLVFVPTPALAAGLTFTVNRIGDAADLAPGNGKCDVSTKSGSQCTLRAAIQEANAHAGTDTIKFNISSSSKTITPGSALPAITQAVTINGYSQNGASANTHSVGDNAVVKVVLNGVNAGVSTDGLDVNAANVVIKGLAIQNFGGNGVTITATNDTIAGNLIGTNAAGDAKHGNGTGVAIKAGGGSDTIGGATAAARNVVSGNKQQGINVVSGNGSDIPSLLIQGNYVGTTKSGLAGLGNGANGIVVNNASNSTIRDNVVSGNTLLGIDVSGMSGYQIAGNIVGAKADRTGSLGNSLGISVTFVTASVIGGTGSDGNLVTANTNAGIDLGHAASGVEVTGNTIHSNGVGVDVGASSADTIHNNTIVSNTGDGISVATISHVGSATRVMISSNSTLANGGLGINLAGGAEDSFGVTANDDCDSDTGSNNLQNFPVLTSAVAHSSTHLTTVSGTLNSTKSTSFTIELFVAAADSSGHGEGQTFLASKSVSTSSTLCTTAPFQFSVANVPAGVFLTATATNADTSDTSEFSANLVVSAGS